MKITMLGHSIPSISPGISMGIAGYIYNLGAALMKSGNEVELFVRNDRRPAERWIRAIYSPKFSWIPYPVFACPAMLRAKADVYHADFVTTGASLVWTKKKPRVVSMHDAIPFTYDMKSLDLGQKLGVRWYMRCLKSARKSDALILMSEHAKKKAISLAGIEPEKAHAVYNGIDHSVFRPMKKPVHDKIRIGYLGGLDGRKNVELLVESFRALQDGNIELHVAGEGSNLERFRAMKLRNAFFHGRLSPENVARFYNSLDIFVMPSLLEGFGMMTLEAMSCGIAVIGVDRSSTPEILGDAGVLVEPDAEKMAKAISMLADNRKLRERTAKKCLERSKLFSWEKCADDTMKIYRSLI